MKKVIDDDYGWIICCKVKIAGVYESTGKTTSYREGKIQPPAAELQILLVPESLEDGDELLFYLFDLDEDGNEMNDTQHDTLAAAKAQARFEFEGLKDEDWIEISDCCDEAGVKNEEITNDVY